MEQISNNTEGAKNHAGWFTENKVLIIDFRVKTHSPVYISGAEVEQVNSFSFLSISVTENLSWSSHISTWLRETTM